MSIRIQINRAVLCLICFVLWTAKQSDAVPVLSPALYERVPNVAERLISQDIHERLGVLDELVVPIGGDVGGFKFCYNLPTQDYLSVLESVFDVNLHGLDREKLQIALGKICYVIQELKLKEITNSIAGYLQNSNPPIQYQILRIFKTVNATEFVPDIVSLLDSSEEWIRREALGTLVEFRAKEAVPYLIEYLQDTKSFNRYYGLTGLVKVGGKEAVSSIAKLLEDPDSDIRYWALDALVKLEGRDYVSDIWELLNGQETFQTESYAIAALIAFGLQDAIPLAIARVTVKDLGLRSQMLDFLVEVHAKTVGPTLVAVLQKDEILGGDKGTDSNIRRDIMVCLGRLEVMEAIPILKQYVKNPKNEFLRDQAISTLGMLKAREGVEDLLPLLNAKVTSNIYTSAEAALSLAKIGDKKTWPQLIEFVDNPSVPYRSKIISELNAFLDPELWQVVHTKKVQGLYIKPVNTAVEAFSRESEIRIILHFQPQENSSNITSSEAAWPRANTSVEKIDLIFGIQNILESFCGKNIPSSKNPYTFIFYDNEIHIMSIAEAIKWWKENILSTVSQSELK